MPTGIRQLGIRERREWVAAIVAAAGIGVICSGSNSFHRFFVPLRTPPRRTPEFAVARPQLTCRFPMFRERVGYATRTPVF